MNRGTILIAIGTLTLAGGAILAGYNSGQDKDGKDCATKIPRDQAAKDDPNSDYNKILNAIRCIDGDGKKSTITATGRKS